MGATLLKWRRAVAPEACLTEIFVTHARVAALFHGARSQVAPRREMREAYLRERDRSASCVNGERALAGLTALATLASGAQLVFRAAAEASARAVEIETAALFGALAGGAGRHAKPRRREKTTERVGRTIGLIAVQAIVFFEPCGAFFVARRLERAGEPISAVTQDRVRGVAGPAEHGRGVLVT